MKQTDQSTLHWLVLNYIRLDPEGTHTITNNHDVY
jgi:hypothetical protein